MSRFQAVLPGAPLKTPPWLVATRSDLPSGATTVTAVAPVWLRGPRSRQTGFGPRRAAARARLT